MNKQLVLKNDFHNSLVRLRVVHAGNVKVGDFIPLTPGQIKKAEDTLCLKGCVCSGYLGIRGSYHILGDKEVKLHVITEYDNLEGKEVVTGIEIMDIW